MSGGPKATASRGGPTAPASSGGREAPASSGAPEIAADGSRQARLPDMPPPYTGTDHVDEARIAAAVRELLAAIGEDPEREGLRDTPWRVAQLYAELFAGYRDDPDAHVQVTFAAGHDEMVMVRDIPFASMCEHHLTPFVGRAHVAYIPNDDGRITGLSKLARVVESYARRLQVQERMTTQIADTLERVLEPRGVLVVLEAEHLCMSMRGVKKPGTLTITSAVRGLFRKDPSTRAEAMGLLTERR